MVVRMLMLLTLEGHVQLTLDRGKPLQECVDLRTAHKCCGHCGYI